ncbi:MAG: hypothetical protein HZA02_07075 [Nitrospinae bacterium]|nr:hypothetical protein [Nitrospinota bacterium]
MKVERRSFINPAIVAVLVFYVFPGFGVFVAPAHSQLIGVDSAATSGTTSDTVAYISGSTTVVTTTDSSISANISGSTTTVASPDGSEGGAISTDGSGSADSGTGTSGSSGNQFNSRDRLVATLLGTSAGTTGLSGDGLKEQESDYGSKVQALVDSLSDEQVFALNRSLNNAVHGGLAIDFEANMELLELVVENNYDKRQINMLSRALEEEAKFNKLAEKTGNDKLLGKAESQKGKFLKMIDKFSSSGEDPARSSGTTMEARLSAREGGRSAVRGTTEDMIKDASKDAVKGTVKDSVKEAARDAAKDAAKTAVKDAAKEAARDAVKEAARDAAKDAAKTAAKDAAKEAARDAVKEAVKVAVNEVKREAQKENASGKSGKGKD